MSLLINSLCRIKSSVCWKESALLEKFFLSVSKVLLEKLFFIVLNISWLFIATQFLLFLSYLQPGDMLWNRNPKYLYKKKFFSQFYYHICHTHTNLLVYSSLMMAIPPISIVTLLPPIATPKFAIIMLKSYVIIWYSVVLFAFLFFTVHWGSWCIDWTKQCFLRSIQPFFRLFITKNGSEAYVMFK